MDGRKILAPREMFEEAMSNPELFEEIKKMQHSLDAHIYAMLFAYPSVYGQTHAQASGQQPAPERPIDYAHETIELPKSQYQVVKKEVQDDKD